MSYAQTDPTSGDPALAKRSGEGRRFYMDFSNKLRDAVIDAITSITPSNRGNISGSANVTTNSERVESNGYSISVVVSGGTDLEDYEVLAIVTTDDGQTLEGVGVLYVRD